MNHNEESWGMRASGLKILLLFAKPFSWKNACFHGLLLANICNFQDETGQASKCSGSGYSIFKKPGMHAKFISCQHKGLGGLALEGSYTNFVLDLRWSVGNDDNENFKLVGYNEWVNLSLIVLVQIHTSATAVSVK